MLQKILVSRTWCVYETHSRPTVVRNTNCSYPQVQPTTVYSTTRWCRLETGRWTLTARDIPGGRCACPSSLQPCWLLQWHSSASAWENSKTVPLRHSSLSATCKVPPWAFCWLQTDSCRLGNYILWWVPVVEGGEMVVGNIWCVNFHIVTVICRW